MRALALFLATAGLLHGADRDFDRAVRAIEKYYGAKPSHIPFIGMANFFLKVARPAGASGLKIATFEDLPDRESDSPAELDHLVSDVVRGDLHPLVVTHSRRNGESSYILAGEIGKTSRILIVTFEPREATVVEVNVNMDALMNMIGKPEPSRRDHLSGDGSR